MVVLNKFMITDLIRLYLHKHTTRDEYGSNKWINENVAYMPWI